MPFFCMGGLENAILLYGGLENAIFCMGVSKIGKISSPSPFLNGIALSSFS